MKLIYRLVILVAVSLLLLVNPKAAPSPQPRPTRPIVLQNGTEAVIKNGKLMLLTPDGRESPAPVGHYATRERRTLTVDTSGHVSFDPATQTNIGRAAAQISPTPSQFRSESAFPTPNRTATQGAQLKIAAVSKEQPYENSLGMKFVPMPGTKVLFSVWDTRVRDFRAYAQAADYRQRGGIKVFKVVKNENGSGSPKWEVDPNASWEEPGFSQSAEHPVVGVSWEEAKAFCAWLTESERKAGLIGDKQEYRLPTDAEWSVAVGESKYPWGNQWPPPEGVGNYFDDAMVATLPGKGWPQVPGNDGFARTSPVGSFKPNPFGLYDMGGNVWQWCEDWYRKEMNEKALLDKYPVLKDDGGGEKYRVLRGAAWSLYGPDNLLSSYRYFNAPGSRNGNLGFRCGLVVESSR